MNIVVWPADHPTGQPSLEHPTTSGIHHVGLSQAFIVLELGQAATFSPKAVGWILQFCSSLLRKSVLFPQDHQHRSPSHKACFRCAFWWNSWCFISISGGISSEVLPSCEPITRKPIVCVKITVQMTGSLCFRSSFSQLTNRRQILKHGVGTCRNWICLFWFSWVISSFV